MKEQRKCTTILALQSIFRIVSLFFMILRCNCSMLQTAATRFQVLSFGYKYPATVDPLVLQGFPTELWAQVWYPSVLNNSSWTEPLPIVFFLHGNHGTCGRGSSPRIDDLCNYTFTGRCPAGYRVVPNHLGYEYSARDLASLGNIVVSINANRGITCNSGGSNDYGLNLARGRLVLRHIELWSKANRGFVRKGTKERSMFRTIRGRVNFEKVGLVGHSRGGEGMRAANFIYNSISAPFAAIIPDKVKIKGIFEIGAVDGQTSIELNAENVAWTQLLPMCDGDVYDLQGIKPFDRMLAKGESVAALKSALLIFGANHNFFNSQWQVSDSAGCRRHLPIFKSVAPSIGQMEIAKTFISEFFLWTNSANWTSGTGNIFSPAVGIPESISSITRIDRAYSPSVHHSSYRTLEDFSRSVGISSQGVPIFHQGLSNYGHVIVPESDPGTRVAAISWDTSQTNPTSPLFRIPFVSPSAETGVDLSMFRFLSLRIGRQPQTVVPQSSDFMVRLIGRTGMLSNPVSLQSVVSDLNGPFGGPYNLHPFMRTVLISLENFGIDLSNIYGVQVDFNRSPKGDLYFGRISAVAQVFSAPPQTIKAVPEEYRDDIAIETKQVGSMSAVRLITGQTNTMTVLANARNVLVALSSLERFTIRDSLICLCVNSTAVFGGIHPNGETRTVAFELNFTQFSTLRRVRAVHVTHGGCTGFREKIWEFPVNVT